MLTLEKDLQCPNGEFRLHSGGEIKTQTLIYGTAAMVCTVTGLACSSQRSSLWVTAGLT